jgi:hypothetical protein
MEALHRKTARPSQFVLHREFQIKNRKSRANDSAWLTPCHQGT